VIWQWVSDSFTKAGAVAATFGLGGGVGIIKFLAHCPAPYESHRWTGCIFDTLEDLVSNTTRIGERRSKDGQTIYIVKPDRPLKAPKAVEVPAPPTPEHPDPPLPKAA
jgi:hypothetical protein